MYDAANKAWTLRYDNYTSSLIQDAGKKDVEVRKKAAC